MEVSEAQRAAWPKAVRIQHPGGYERVCAVVEIGPKPVVTLRWDEGGTGAYGTYDASLNNGRLKGGQLRLIWSVHPEDLEVCRARAREQGIKVNPCGLGGRRKSNGRNRADKRQIGLFDE